MEVKLVDLRDHPLPFFDEMASNLWVPSQNPEAIRWQETVGRFDAYIFVVAEHNHLITGVLAGLWLPTPRSVASPIHTEPISG